MFSRFFPHPPSLTASPFKAGQSGPWDCAKIRSISVQVVGFTRNIIKRNESSGLKCTKSAQNKCFLNAETFPQKSSNSWISSPEPKVANFQLLFVLQFFAVLKFNSIFQEGYHQIPKHPCKPNVFNHFKGHVIESPILTFLGLPEVDTKKES